jgi:type I restriction enzyme, S subunit
MARNELPAGWKMARLGDLGELRLGKMLDKSKNEGDWVQYLRNINIRWFSFALDDLQELRIGQDECEDLSVADGDLLICEGGEPGRCAVWRGGRNRLVYQKALHRFRTFGAVLPEWVMYFLKHEVASGRLQDAFTGTTIKHLTKESLVRYAAAVPPIREQKRIADKLDAVLARVETCHDRLNLVPAILKRFRQAVLADALSGRLTEEWRESNEESHWADVPVRSISWVGTGSTPLRSNPSYYATAGTPWITSAATSQSFVNGANEFVTEVAIAAHRLKLYPVGTLLVAMYGEGKTRGQVTELAIPATINQACAAIIVDPEKALRSYVKLVLRANYFEMRKLAEGGNQPNLNLNKIKDFVFPLPNHFEQTEIVRGVESLFAWADRLEARVTAARAQVDRLTPALLAKAFRGELVPQDPADEPAGELLARIIRDKGESTSAAGKRGRVPKRKAQAPLAHSPLAGEGGG